MIDLEGAPLMYK